LRDVGVPHRFGSFFVALEKTAAQAGDRTAFRAVDLQRQQVVAAHAHRPGRVEMRDRAAGELEGRVRRVVRGRLVLLAVLVPAMRNVRRAEAAHRLHLAEEVVEHIAPVAEHVEDDAAAVLLAVIPRRPLRRNAVTLKYPITEFTSYGKDLAEETLVAQLRE